MTRGLILAAPASGSGKTVVTLGLLRHFREAGVSVASAKVGPDYIDGAFHAAATGRPCVNLDTWAMRPATLAALVARLESAGELVLVEGVMGLFDGAPACAGDPAAPQRSPGFAEARHASARRPPGGAGSTAELAARTGWPVVLVVDVRGMGASVAALVHGYASFREDAPLAGVLFNRVGGPGHAALLREALAGLDVPVLGALPRRAELELPDRHLGLVQATEQAGLEETLAHAAAWASGHLDIAALANLARPATRLAGLEAAEETPLPPLGQRIAVARDPAFAFAYPHVLDGWRAAGAGLAFFSPLADEAPDPAADAVFLPGGYPELHAGRLAAAGRFLGGLRAAAGRGAFVYGECGGYMVLGQGLEDADGRRHAMADLLPVETSFAAPRMTLGYREARLAVAGPLGAAGAAFRGHEFHFARLLGGEGEAPLFTCSDAAGRAVGPAGGRAGRVMGSFVHLVDRREDAPR